MDDDINPDASMGGRLALSGLLAPHLLMWAVVGNASTGDGSSGRSREPTLDCTLVKYPSAVLLSEKRSDCSAGGRVLWYNWSLINR